MPEKVILPSGKAASTKYIFPRYVFLDVKGRNKIAASGWSDFKQQKVGNRISADYFSSDATQKALQQTYNKYMKMVYSTNKTLQDDTGKNLFGTYDEIDSDFEKNYSAFEQELTKTIERSFSNNTDVNKQFDTDLNNIKQSLETIDDINQYIDELDKFIHAYQPKIWNLINGKNKSNDVNIYSSKEWQQAQSLMKHAMKIRYKSGELSGTPEQNLKKIRQMAMGGFNHYIQGAANEYIKTIQLATDEAFSNISNTGSQVVRKSLDQGLVNITSQMKPDTSGFYIHHTKSGNKIEIAFGVSIKHFIETENTKTFGKSLTVTSADTNARYFIEQLEDSKYFLASNILAHEEQDSPLFQGLGRFITASFFYNFIAGTGAAQMVGNKEVYDIANVLVVNDKVYSMAAVLKEVSDSAVKQLSGNYMSASYISNTFKKKGLSVSSLRSKNVWEPVDNNGQKDYQKQDWGAAYMRSSTIANMALDSVKIGVKLNTNILKNIVKNIY